MNLNIKISLRLRTSVNQFLKSTHFPVLSFHLHLHRGQKPCRRFRFLQSSSSKTMRFQKVFTFGSLFIKLSFCSFFNRFREDYINNPKKYHRDCLNYHFAADVNTSINVSFCDLTIVILQRICQYLTYCGSDYYNY